MIPPRQIVAADIGGTNARFAIADVADGRVTALGEAVTLRTAAFSSLAAAFGAFAARHRGPIPREAGIAVAGPVGTSPIKLTNSPWVIRPERLAQELGLDGVTLVNDFGAVGHAVGQLAPGELRHLCGPAGPLPETGVIGIVGPGTGLGVAQLLRGPSGDTVVETEGGHADFAPLDAIEDAILARLRARYRRVSVERIVSGPGLAAIHEALAAIDGAAIAPALDDAALWARALAGDDRLAAAALDRFCMSLGSFAGDVALIGGAAAVVIGGGIGLRLADHLPRSGFAARFVAKGRFEHRLAAIPVRLILHAEPGLLGAAAARSADTRAARPSA